MTILDTSIIIDRIKKRKEIVEDITIITAAEYPPLLEYSKFYGNVIYPVRKDLDLTIELQIKLRKIGKPKPFSDLLIAAICINRNEELITKDTNFKDITRISKLRVKILQ